MQSPLILTHASFFKNKHFIFLLLISLFISIKFLAQNFPMNSESNDNFALQNLTKDKKLIPKNKTLTKAIENSDLSFIQEFLTSEEKFEDISNLSRFYKCKLIPLLIEFLDQPLRIEAIQCIYEILNDVGNVDIFGKVLLERCNDFNKLVYLKGKIDYLKYLQKPKIEENAENEYLEAE